MPNVTVSTDIDTFMQSADKAAGRSNLGLGTAATVDVPSSGNASSSQAVKGDDTRLSNARTPSAHKSTHAVGGTDALSASDIGAAASTHASTHGVGGSDPITSVALTSASTITVTPSSGNDIVNKTYADSIGSGINFHDAADYATLAVLSPAATYNQPGGAGVGVGATLTGSTNVPLVVDGITVATGKRILVKNQGSAFQNGIYTVTQQGDNATVPYILTRASDYDTSGSGINEVQAGDFVLVLSSTLANTAWVQQTPAPINFGVTAINFTQFAAAAASVTTFSADATGFTPSTATNGTVTLGGTLNVAHGGTNQTFFTDGQLLIGNTTGNTLAKSTLTAGTGMTVTNGSGAITLTAKGLGTQVKTVGIDAATIQACIDLCTDADSEHPYTILIPPIANSYGENLTLKGSVSLLGLTTSLNADAVQITGAHTFAPASAQANTNRINFQNLTFISGGTGSNTITCASSTKYCSKLTFSGCIFSGDKADTYSHIKTDDNISVYVDNCRFESSAGGSASAGITQGNGPLYLSNNTTIDVYGRALDVPASTTTTRTATVTGGVGGSTTMTLTSGTTTGLAVGMRISGANLGTTVTIVSLTAPSTVIMSTTPKTSGSFTATFGQTPYVEIHDSVLSGKGTEVVRLGNGLLTGNGFNVSNTATGGSGINMLTANTVVGIVSSSFAISDAAAYVITAAAATCYAALNGISYSSSILGAYSTLIGANVTVLDYAARATSVANGGTGATTQQAAINALAGAVTANQVLAGNGTNITLRALAAADIPSLAASKITSGQLAVAQGGTGAATLTGILKGNGTSAITPATSGTDYVAGADVSSYKVTAVLDTSLSLSGATVTATKITFPSGAQSNIDSHVLAAGDIIFLAASTTTPNSSATKGPWVITTAGATGVSAVWDRPVWWTTSTARSGVLFSTNQGSTYQGSVWTIYPTAGSDVLINVGTTGLTALNVSLKAGLPVASGGTGATDAATARTNLSAATFADVQIFTSNGTWTKPTGSKLVNVQILGAGGGGGGGRKDTAATVARFGGGGGGGGGSLNVTFPAAAVGATETVTIGAGGTGGAGSSATGSGSAGNNGGTTSFGTLICPGAIGGGGGTNTSGSAGTAILSGSSGGASSATAVGGTGAPISATSTANFGGAGGGAGGGLSTADVAFGGGPGGRSQALNQAGGAAGGNTGAAGSNGYDNATATLGYLVAGSGGGGGGAGTTVSGGAGGAGGFPSGGGGGGGATISGTTSGAGAAGANGLAIITTYF
jgi:hypothetical protein